MQASHVLQDYQKWIADYDTLQENEEAVVREAISRLHSPPLFSIILLPAEDGGRSDILAAIRSIEDQIYPHWELWLPDLLAQAGTPGSDSRIRSIPAEVLADIGHARFFNHTLDLVDGDFIIPFSSEARLSPTGLYELAMAIQTAPNVELLYSDEDTMDATGSRSAPRFKTAWDPDLALGRDIVGSLAVYRNTLLRRIEGMRTGLSNVTLAFYDLSLRSAALTSPTCIHHVPAILCHRNGNATSVENNPVEARAIVQKLLAGGGTSALVTAAALQPDWNRVIRAIPNPAPLVSIIVPTRDRAELLAQCVEGVLSRTDYPSIELLIVDNDSQDDDTLALFRRLSLDPRVRILSSPGIFNYSVLNNLAAREAVGDVLVLLNNDTNVIDPGWLSEMVSHALRPDVGAVGAKLLYADERVQHAGLVFGPGFDLIHQLRFSGRQEVGPLGELALTRTVSAVTGACLALRRSVFLEVGGLDERLRVAFNDIDLCLRIGDHGYRIVWTPFAEMYHFEGMSRGYDDTPEKQEVWLQELAYFCCFWRSLLPADPFHNPNMTYGPDTTRLAFPPRHLRPWHTSRKIAVDDRSGERPASTGTGISGSTGRRKGRPAAADGIGNLGANTHWKDPDLRTWQMHGRDAEHAHSRMVLRIDAARRDIYVANRRAEQSEAAFASAMVHTRQVQNERDRALEEQGALLASTMWQMTWPLRMVSSHLPQRFRQGARLSARLVWWSLTLMMFRKQSL